MRREGKCGRMGCRKDVAESPEPNRCAVALQYGKFQGQETRETQYGEMSHFVTRSLSREAETKGLAKGRRTQSRTLLAKRTPRFKSPFRSAPRGTN